MKKVKSIGILASITALAIGAGATYAWFTDTADPTSLTVNAATIAIDSVTMDAKTEDRLPGEEIGFLDWEFDNQSSRPSVVEFSLTADKIAFADDENGDYNPEDREARKNFLLKELNKSFLATGITSGNNLRYPDEDNGRIYLWLNDGDQLDNGGQFSITLTIPEELGGNVGAFEGSGTPDRLEEHGAIITLNCQAYAVQGTYAALADVFGPDVADYFFQ